MLDDLSRRKIFYLLKRYSSLSLWRRIFEAHQPFFQAAERMATHHPENDPDWMQRELYKHSLDDQVNFQHGLKALASGDRSVFRDHDEGYLHRVLSNEWSADGYVFGLVDSGGAGQFEPLAKLAGAASELAEGAYGTIEPKPDEPAAWYPEWMLKLENLPKHPFPDPLPPVPAPPEPPVLVETGEEVPVDGIYEPDGDDTGMNYLLGGTVAPTVKSPSKVFVDDNYRIIWPNTTWRLIWEDHRYEDGAIPEEEKDYFAPILESAPQEPQAKGRALPGETCTRPGFWWTLAKPDSRRWFNHGEIFPDFPDSRIAQTIWNFDSDQE